MTWTRFLKDGRVQRHTTSRNELNELRKAIERDLNDSEVESLSADRRFGIVFSAAVLLARMAVACAGYRVKGSGQNYTCLKSLPLVLGEHIEPLASYLDDCRELRNAITYETAGMVSDSEAVELKRQVQLLRDEIEAWIAANHPELAHHAG